MTQGAVLRFAPYSDEPQEIAADQLAPDIFGRLPGEPDPFGWALEHAVPIWQRCAHWTSLLLVTSFDDNRVGCFEFDPEKEVISLAVGGYETPQLPYHVTGALHHEIAHAVARRLPEWQDHVTRYLRPIETGHDYCDSPSERFARVYEHAANLADEIGEMLPFADLSLIYTGKVSAAIRRAEERRAAPAKKSLLSRVFA